MLGNSISDVSSIDHKIVAASPDGFLCSLGIDARERAPCLCALAAATLPGGLSFVTSRAAAVAGSSLSAPAAATGHAQRHGQVWAGQSRAPVAHAKI